MSMSDHREPINPATAKKALSSYIKGLIQDFYNETGMHVQDIEVKGKIDCTTNKWQVENVEVRTDLEVV
jgi:hypothetical protein